MDLDLLNDVIIYRNNYKNIKYNTRIENPDNCRLVIMNNGACRRMNRIEGNILNPRKLSIFNRNKIDLNAYTVFKVKGNYFDGTWGGNVQYLDRRLGNIQEKVFIRATYSFQIYSPERAVMLISDNQEQYDVIYMNIKINLKIDNIIKNCIVKRLNELGFINTQNEIVNISKEAENIINETILSEFGISLINLNMILEESDDHYFFRKEHEWEKIKEKEVKDNGII